jgi:hypothetical protein
MCGDPARVGQIRGIAFLVGAIAEADAEALDALRGLRLRIMATTELESRPPDRKAPTGTSATSWRRTACSTRAFNSAAISARGRKSREPSYGSR